MESRIGRDYGNGIAADTRMPLLNNDASRRTTSTAKKLGGLFQDWWLWEVMGATTCLLALSVIIVILAVFDSSSLPDWPSVFTVRSVVLSLVSAVCN